MLADQIAIEAIALAPKEPIVTAEELTVSASRITWIDVARGLAIILIVMHHARDYALIAIPVHSSDMMRWAYVEPLLVHIRLPLFFTLSGALAFGLGKGSDTKIKSRRALSLTAVYFAWSLVMLGIVPLWPGDGWYFVGTKELAMLLTGQSVLWYLWALVVAFSVTAVTRSLPAWMMLAGACIVAALFGQHHAASGETWRQVGFYLPCYMFGARYGGALLRLAAWRNLRAIGFLTILYMLLLNPLFAVPGADLVRSGAGAALGIIASSALVAAYPVAASRFAWLGQRTLPIYVLHFPIVAWLGCAAVRLLPVFPRPVELVLLLPTLTGATVTASLLCWTLLCRLGLSWTLAIPGRRRA